MNPKLKILVVDDMTTMRKLVIKACKDMGFTDISEAADGAKAWELCLNANPAFDLVISDWNMPNCTGLDFLKRVRADGRLKGTPFMLLTAESEASQVSEAIKAGVNNYVVKPFTGDSLREKVTDTLKKAGR
jgi:two-component system chemotaxis response regulator CheY